MNLILIVLSLWTSSLLAGTPSLGEPLAKWSKNKISVCFGNQESSKKLKLDQGIEIKDLIEYTHSEKKLIKDALSSQYNLNEVGITFTGWKNCSKSSADIHLIKINKPELNNGGSSSSIGMDSIRSKTFCISSDCQYSYHTTNSDEQQYVFINVRPMKERKTSDELRLQLIILHEFGHAVGLRHEHIRPEARDDKNCYRLSDGETIETPDSSTATYGPYDSNSIMNYCHLDAINWIAGPLFVVPQGQELPINLTDQSIFTTSSDSMGTTYTILPRLSAGDKHALKCMYVYEGEAFEKNCKPI